MDAGGHRAGRLDYIDAMRGIAALMVIYQHAAQLPHNAGSALFDPSLFAINFGRFGVELFFLISGFVIPFSFKGTEPIRAFWWSRLFRLFPAYWLSIPLMIWLIHVRGYTVNPVTVLANLTMVQNLLGHDNLGFGYWTLNFEMGFYLLCTALFAARVLHSLRVVALVIAAGLGGAVGSHVLHDLHGIGTAYDFPFFVATFFLGLMLRRAFLDADPVAIAWCRWLVPATVLAGAVLGGLFWPVELNRNIYFKPVVLALSQALPPLAFVAVLWWKPAVPRSLVWLGAVSYSLYLFQDLWLIMLPFVLSPGAHPLAFVAICCALCVGTAAVVYYAVERPMIALGRRLAERQGLAPARAPAPAG